MWAADAWSDAAGTLAQAAWWLGRLSCAAEVADAGALTRIQHHVVGSVMPGSADRAGATRDGSRAVTLAGSARPSAGGNSLEASTPLAHAIRLGVLHAVPLPAPIGAPTMASAVAAHKALTTATGRGRSAGRPRTSEVPSPVMPRASDGTPCLAASPRDLLRHGASIDATLQRMPDTIAGALVGSAWFVWASMATVPVPDATAPISLHLSAAWLCGAARLPVVALDLSERTHGEIAPHAMTLARNGSVADWCSHQWNSVIHACGTACQQLDALGRTRTALLAKASAMRAPRHPSQLAHALIRMPLVDVRSVERELSLTFAAANDLVDRCVEHGLLREITGKRRGRVYQCDESVEALSPLVRDQPRPKSLRTAPNTPASV